MPTTISTPMTQAVQETSTMSNEQKDKKANDYIRNATIASSLTGVIPMTGIDILANTTVQTVMIREMAELYGLNFRESAANTFLTSLVGSSIARIVTELVSSVAPSSIAGIDFTNVAISGIYTASVGSFYHDHFKNGGTLEDVSLEEFTDFFINEFKEGNLSLSTISNPSRLMSYLF